LKILRTAKSAPSLKIYNLNDTLRVLFISIIS
jgi:hypothetical protein